MRTTGAWRRYRGTGYSNVPRDGELADRAEKRGQDRQGRKTGSQAIGGPRKTMACPTSVPQQEPYFHKLRGPEAGTKVRRRPFGTDHANNHGLPDL
jgi:hypothetical protein